MSAFPARAPYRTSRGIYRILLSLAGSFSHLLPQRRERSVGPAVCHRCSKCLTRRSGSETVTSIRWKGPWTRSRGASRMPLDRVRLVWPGSRSAAPPSPSASIRPTWRRSEAARPQTELAPRASSASAFRAKEKSHGSRGRRLQGLSLVQEDVEGAVASNMQGGRSEGRSDV